MTFDPVSSVTGGPSWGVRPGPPAGTPTAMGTFMDERALDALQQQLHARSWVFPDPASHAAGVEETVSALRSLLRSSRHSVDDTGRLVGRDHRSHAG